MQAYIADYVELSSIDIPGKVIDVIYFAGCDYNCPICNLPEYMQFKEDFLIDLREIKKRMKANHSGKDAILFTGGEPCLQRQAMLELAKYAKKLGLKIILKTNGSKPDCIQSMLKGKYIDTVMMDIKSPFNLDIFEKVTKSKTFFKTVDGNMQDVMQTLEFLDKSDVDIQFKTLIVPSLIYRKEDILDIAKEIVRFNTTWILSKFLPGNCLRKKYDSINAPTDNFMNTLKEFILNSFPKMKIEIE